MPKQRTLKPIFFRFTAKQQYFEISFRRFSYEINQLIQDGHGYTLTTIKVAEPDHETLNNALAALLAQARKRYSSCVLLNRKEALHRFAEQVFQSNPRLALYALDEIILG